MDFDPSLSDAAEPLGGFLAGTQGVELQARIIDVDELSEAHRRRVQSAHVRGLAWTAWSTEHGPVAAWGEYDVAGSKRLNAYVLFAEWYGMPNGQHALWCYCHPGRPTEWIAGRGRA
jgi:hypothetical protein